MLRFVLVFSCGVVVVRGDKTAARFSRNSRTALNANKPSCHRKLRKGECFCVDSTDFMPDFDSFDDCCRCSGGKTWRKDGSER